MRSIMSQRQSADAARRHGPVTGNIWTKKKGLILRPALKESLNQKVSKGPEETTNKNYMFLKNLTWVKYLRVCPNFCRDIAPERSFIFYWLDPKV